MMCPAWGKSGICFEKRDILSEDLSIEILRRFIDDLSTSGTTIVLSGGEPLLYKDWYELAQYVKEKNLLLALQTNGVLLNDNAEKILTVVDQLNVSIDGVMEIHNKVRGGDNCFSKIVEGLKRTKELKSKLHKRNPRVGVCYTITPWNYQYLRETLGMLCEIDVGMDFMNFMQPMFIQRKQYEKYAGEYGAKFNIGDVLSGFLFEFESFDIFRLAKEITDIKKSSLKYKGTRILFTPDLNDEELIKYYDRNADLTDSKVDCLTPWMDAFLFPNGDLYACCGNLLGNIKEKSVKELWNNNYAREFRKTFLKEGYLPICRNCAFKRRSSYFKIPFALSLLFNEIRQCYG